MHLYKKKKKRKKRQKSHIYQKKKKKKKKKKRTIIESYKVDRGSIQTTPSAPKPMGCSCGPFACHCYTAFARAKPAFIKILPTAAVVLWLWIQLAWISRVRHGFLYHWILPFTFHFSGFSSHFFYTHTHTHTHTHTRTHPLPTHTHAHTHMHSPPPTPHTWVKT